MQTARRLVKGPDTAETSEKNLADTGHGCEPMNYSRKPFVWWELPLATKWVHIGDRHLIW